MRRSPSGVGRSAGTRRVESFQPEKPLADYSPPYFRDKLTITGSPTFFVDGDQSGYTLRRNNHIAIDCGCVHGYPLGVYCLGTKEGFYVEAEKGYWMLPDNGGDSLMTGGRSMMKTLEEKIKKIKRDLLKECVYALATFDLKDGEEDGKLYCEAYLDKAKKSVACLNETEWDELTPWEKLCCFKVSGEIGVDCDAALRSTVIYQLVFGGGEITPQKRYSDRYLLERDELTLCGDTMNSYATTMHKFFHKVLGANPELVKEMKTKKIISKREKDLLYTVDEATDWEQTILRHYSFFDEHVFKEVPAALQFFRLCHTVGNFIPVPKGIGSGNFQSRGNDSRPRGNDLEPICDYWDLTLLCIYYYYRSREETELKWMPAGEDRSECCRWLDSFGTWNGFVEQNFLQDFVGPDGSPKELWNGHFANGTMPKKKADFEQFFTNASKWIMARGVRVARAIKETLAGELLWNEDRGLLLACGGSAGAGRP